MWLLRTVQLVVWSLFVWFMVFEVLAPLWMRQPIFPMFRKKKEEPAKAESKPEVKLEVKREEEDKHE